jgi:hypothetical protein
VEKGVMNSFLEIVMPLRNPGDKLIETVGSLEAQTERNFSVLISDNFSSTGREWIDRALSRLQVAGIPARLVRPPFELGRVEHWNWAHGQVTSDWLKPLFVGDLLAPRYVKALLARVVARPKARLVRCEFTVRTSENEYQATRAPCLEQTLTPVEFLRYFPHLGNWIGGPVNQAYHREAWRAAGGFMPQLPACADFQLSVIIALRHGIELINEALATFQLHTQRFSHGITRRGVNGCFEVWLILRCARNYCYNAHLPWPRHGVGAGVRRQMKINYFDSTKLRLKAWMRGRSLL